jgi:hypothetical protein
MQLPKENASYLHRVSYGLYVARRLRRAKLTTLAATVKAVSLEVKAKGRARDDAAEPILEALADRDGADLDLDTIAQNTRANLAGRSKDAPKLAPYTSIFPDGSTFYTAATLADEVKNYQALIERIQTYLPADDLAQAQIPAITQGISDFQAASNALTQTRTAKGLRQTDLDIAEDTWTRTLHRVYGSLIEQFGKGAFVESFFPKPSHTTKADAL